MIESREIHNEYRIRRRIRENSIAVRGLLIPNKKLGKKSDYRKCLKCQQTGRLVSAQEQSVQKFCDAAEIHKDIILYMRG